MAVVINEFELIPDTAPAPRPAAQPESGGRSPSEPEKAAELARLLHRNLERQRRVRVY
ncbi:hypothetical protein ATI61_11386 [Archangium gephyra]|uniref:Uncharacterized protein n=1 Tax=Archangium gephyra TaxID=48 RepID=A0AAC8TEF0_9BACT|nr:hypothetical protein [Archangium gephyra]AKJ02897.1 Hypothetical protein AA314_04523 [Archangium gephyra]REG25023.1 hypothetical protein ATI61_11386 [Archangium gephyra]